MKFQNALVSNILDRSQRYFAHVTTVTLSWRVQNIVVIGRVYFTLECFEFSSNFEFDRNMLSGTGARLNQVNSFSEADQIWFNKCLYTTISIHQSISFLTHIDRPLRDSTDDSQPVNHHIANQSIDRRHMLPMLLMKLTEVHRYHHWISLSA